MSLTPAILIKARHNGATLPADTACVAGSFRPVDDDDDGQTLPEFITQSEDGFPGGPAAPATTSPLSTFNGIDPNGTWRLYLVDDGPNAPNPSGSAGRIAGGWSLSVTAGGAVVATSTTVGGSSSTTRATGATVPSSTTSTVAGTTTSTELHARVVVTATTTAAIPNTGTDSGDMAVIGIICLLLGLSVLMPRLRNGKPWSIPPVR